HQGKMASTTNQENNHQCPICDKAFASPIVREDHLRRSQCGLTCKLCRKIFSSDIDLKKHGKTAHARCYCSICDKLCISRQARVYHERHMHFRCRPCERMFRSQEQWDHHTETHHHFIRCSKCNCFIREINGEWDIHWENCHGPYRDDEENGGNCTAGSKERIDVKHPKKNHPKPKPKEKSLRAGIPDFYGCLNINPSSTHADIAQAARKRRIEVHPDKLKKPSMTDAELERIDQVAMQVGWAADVLLDPEKRAKYDGQYFSMRK
ncbi:MAG: hypothetical protein Q9216_006452, partial [Gyalolechia sp. 2 TL-2023]